jgi:hypothetical protein
MMAVEDRLSEGMRNAENAANFVQRVWKGRLGKIHFHVVRVAHVRNMALLAVENEKAAREKAVENKHDRLLIKWNENLNAIRIQNFVRITFARRKRDVRVDARLEAKYSTLIQAGYRGRMARRHVASMLRIKEWKTIVKKTVHERNASYMRACGLRKRPHQRVIAQILASSGLLPSSFLLNFQELLKEIHFDFGALKRQWDQLNDVLWNAKRDDVPIVNTLTFVPAVGELVDFEKEMKIRKKWLQIEFELFGIIPTDCVQVVYPGHDRHGETGVVLSIEQASKIAEIRFDVDALTEFIPMITEMTAYQDESKTLIKIEPVGFHYVKEVTSTWSKLAQDDLVGAKTKASVWKSSLLALAQWEIVLQRDFVNARR